MLGGWWASKIFFAHKRGASSTFRLRFTLLSRTGVQSPWRFELRKAPKEAVDPGFVSFSPFQEACPDLFLSRALPAAGCDSKLSLGSGMQSSELSRQSLAYPCPTEINLARPVRVSKFCSRSDFGSLSLIGCSTTVSWCEGVPVPLKLAFKLGVGAVRQSILARIIVLCSYTCNACVWPYSSYLAASSACHVILP